MEPLHMVRYNAGRYIVNGPLTEEVILGTAAEILKARYMRAESISRPEDTKQYLVHRLAPLEHEVFAVIFLDSQHRIIVFEEMFRGTLSRASIYPREVVKRALALNASACVFAHNHPSGTPEPSLADIGLTNQLKSALDLIDVRVLDHIVVGGTETTSFAERGLI